jgi:NAD(P)-dependent dehydrogenase (short-subunit alcohol dehydrogenase family)
MTARLDERVAIVTGSTHGIGRAIAVRLAEHGARVVVTGRDEHAGQHVLDDIKQLGGQAAFVQADLLQPDIGEVLVGAAEDAFGLPTILVNNAASSDLVRDGTDRAISEIDDASWNRVIEVNLTGPMRVTRSTLRAMMRAGSGAIVNISSRAASVGVPGIDGYTAVKGAIEALTRSLAVEYAEYGIRCNCIQVSFVQVVDERPNRPSLDADGDERIRRLLLTRGGRPADIASAVLYLVSPDAEFVTGVVLPVDGGASVVSGLPWTSPRPGSARGEDHWSTRTTTTTG